ncbi:TPA: hydantoinase/oxoprolinase family protein [Pseudomonas putida]|uniref:hydantoinase/oxoprolinase family protein n=1 Tax=Pseudomonas putida TaxID=303 RepID=UPI00110CD1D0|nr:hydantoinase/oxoprolinase family protein [Pseudomonas putida]MDD1993592.1 hydantoinase/oxoprolinase family protein [Pseudomonas putida]HDS0916502.1 hydantoinase/oxoprolinase family protein [Pseudomonas putida]HDS0932137.1 hydantoinase/oxoprolinase family protein [Pseudomonas putida]HDS1781544.1 hydantoinase/oxoprolinase family protein [Pseudomonas putida]HDS3797140.1 hydantoinase/oxoprolinase family protein [Pseudomonas putida]
MTATSCRVGVDIGGTFTDIALDVNGVLHSTKILTDYELPERAILTGVRQVVEQAGLALSDIDQLIHGTTLATNALIERRGARTAFITTEGFRDTLEMRTENRFEQYDINIVLPPPLIDREHRYTLRERLDVKGHVLIAPLQADIDVLVERIGEGNYESVAIGFIHSYVNGAHERQLRDALQARLPQLSISISSEVSPQMREFERFNTVCANAYVKPLIKSYLDRLVVTLKQEGADCPVFMIHSGGGIISVQSAAEFPVRLVESGPAGGAIFAADIARRYQLENVLSFDMGGTTAKICLIEDQVPKTAKTFEVARTYRFKKGSGMPISIPVVEMVEIGAGGGSIASIDSMRQIRVGPHSAASEPGPACYGRGGLEPTITDANLLLGRLDADNFAGGALRLSSDSAANAMARVIGQPLGIAADTAAFGVCEVVDENMANAGRVHAVESGKDIADYTMITFGGGGPLHAARLCEKMGVSRFIVPAGAGVGSAIGFLRAPFGYEAVRSAFVRLSEFDAARINDLIEEMKAESLSFLRQGMPEGEPEMECTAFMRYVGQGWEIPVSLPFKAFSAADTAQFKHLFEEAYTRFFGRPIDGPDIEIVSWSVKASSPLPPVARIEEVSAVYRAHHVARRQVFDVAAGGFVDTGIYPREELQVGARVDGPAIIVERETSTFVTSNFAATVQPDGCLLVVRR